MQIDAHVSFDVWSFVYGSCPNNNVRNTESVMVGPPGSPGATGITQHKDIGDRKVIVSLHF